MRRKYYFLPLDGTKEVFTAEDALDAMKQFGTKYYTKSSSSNGYAVYVDSTNERLSVSWDRNTRTAKMVW